mmetsp:Transcript_20749/g.34709  ORF Transcript_20749/g.34709 Transcript_20749/m.34709 type:complete len:236 (-) Transcript_20749:87-794(-)
MASGVLMRTRLQNTYTPSISSGCCWHPSRHTMQGRASSSSSSRAAMAAMEMGLVAATMRCPHPLARTIPISLSICSRRCMASFLIASLVTVRRPLMAREMDVRMGSSSSSPPADSASDSSRFSASTPLAAETPSSWCSSGSRPASMSTAAATTHPAHSPLSAANATATPGRATAAENCSDPFSSSRFLVLLVVVGCWTSGGIDAAGAVGAEGAGWVTSCMPSCSKGGGRAKEVRR